jgi:predicted nucleic acid-binding protein
MSRTLVRCVIDASVGIKLFIAGDLTEHVDALFGLLAVDPPAQFYVPDLFYVECANVLWKQTRWAGYSATKAREDLKNLAALALRRVSNVDLLAETIKIAAEENISAYDACYVALAQREKIPLVTADEKLVRALAKSKYDVRWLGSFSLPQELDNTESV